MPKYTTIGITNINRERASKVAPLWRELRGVQTDEALPLEYRQRRERELRAQIERINEDASRRIVEAATEAAEEPQRNYAAGTGLKAEQLAEVPLIVEQYRGRTPPEQRQLVAEIAADLSAGATARALVKARAATTLRIPLGSVEPQLAKADPIKRDAQDALDAIKGLAEVALAEPQRELAMAGLATASQRLALLNFAAERGLRPDASFAEQVQPGYSGPSVEGDGYPSAPFPEPHDPQRDQQRERVGHLRNGARADEWLAQERRSGGLASPPPEPRHEAPDGGKDEAPGGGKVLRRRRGKDEAPDGGKDE